MHGSNFYESDAKVTRIWVWDKSQIISKANYLVLDSWKNPKKFCPNSWGKVLQIFFSFFWNNWDQDDLLLKLSDHHIQVLKFLLKPTSLFSALTLPTFSSFYLKHSKLQCNNFIVNSSIYFWLWVVKRGA